MSVGAWASVTIELLETGTDWKTAGRVFGPLEGYNVKLTIRHDDPVTAALVEKFGGETFDARIVDACTIDGKGLESRGGIAFHEINDDGDCVGDVMFVAYENIESIGVY